MAMVARGPISLEKRDGAIHSHIEERVCTIDFPLAIWAPAPPFAFGELVALIPKGEKAERYAKLFTSSPALLAALIHIRDYARDSRTGRMLTGEGYAMAEAAIAKATGT